MIIVVIVCVAILAGGAWIYQKNAPKPQADVLTANQEALARADSFKIKAPNEKVTVVEFGDFQCPACSYAEPEIEKLRAQYKDTVTFVYRNFPLVTIHKNAMKSAQMSYIANEQGKYWEMHDKLYATQQEWETLNDPSDLFISYAAALGLNTSGMKEKLSSTLYQDKINADVKDGELLGVNSTPTFFVGNTIIRTANAGLVKAAIDEQLKNK